MSRTPRGTSVAHATTPSVIAWVGLFQLPHVPMIESRVAGAAGRIAVAGDWHGNIDWVRQVVTVLRDRAPEVDTIFQLGDFGFFPHLPGNEFVTEVDAWCTSAGIKRVIVTPGNHEDWSELDKLFAAHPGEPVRVSEVVWMLPRGFRFTLSGHTFLSFGGAASVDFEWRSPGRDWWVTETPTAEQVDAAIAGGPADVMLAHETVSGATAEVERILRVNPLGFSPLALGYSAVSRRRVTKVWDAVRPTVLAHGHMHVRGEIEMGDGRRVYSLAQNGLSGNVGLLDPWTLTWEWLDE